MTATLLLHVSGWLFLRQDSRVWKDYLKKQTDRALSANSALLIAASIFAVVREGGETILFLHVLAKTNGGWTATLISGIVSAFLALAALLLTASISLAVCRESEQVCRF